MPQIIIQQPMADYVKYTKHKAREEIVRAIAIIIIGVAFFILVGWMAWNGIHVP